MGDTGAKEKSQAANIVYSGPEIETWLGVEEGTDPAIENDWGNLPFMALSDGAHAYVQCLLLPLSRHWLIAAQLHRRLLLLHAAPLRLHGRLRYPPRDVPIWCFMHETTWIE